MDVLTVVQVDGVYNRVDCEEGIAYELSEYFTFTIDNAQFHPLVKKHLWDGRISLFRVRDHLLYRGLLPRLLLFAQERGYDVVGDIEQYGDQLSKEEITTFVTSLNLPSEIEHRDYQLTAFYECLYHQGKIVISPTGSGKSLLLYLLVRYFLEAGLKGGLLVVPTTSLVEQMYSDFKSYGWTDIDQYVHRQYAGKDKSIRKFLTISTWQSLMVKEKLAYDASYFEQFEFVLGDEAHLFKAKSLIEIMTSLINTQYRIGCTGTLDGSKIHQWVLEGLFGPVMQNVTTRQLMDAGYLSPLVIKALVLEYPPDYCKALHKLKYPTAKKENREKKSEAFRIELQTILSNTARMAFIRKLALALKGNTLILFTFVDTHGKILLEEIEKYAEKGRPIHFIHGEIATENRESSRKQVEGQADAIIIASYGTFSTGVNIKNLHNIITASPSKSQVRILQSIGRSIRQADGKTHATLYDIVDNCQYKSDQNFLLKHFLHRVDIYNAEQFPYSVYPIKIKGTL